MTLQELFKSEQIRITDENGNLRNLIDVLEDLYLCLSPSEYGRLMERIAEEELLSDVFNIARKGKYGEK